MRRSRTSRPLLVGATLALAIGGFASVRALAASSGTTAPAGQGALAYLDTPSGPPGSSWEHMPGPSSNDLPPNYKGNPDTYVSHLVPKAVPGPYTDPGYRTPLAAGIANMRWFQSYSNPATVANAILAAGAATGDPYYAQLAQDIYQNDDVSRATGLTQHQLQLLRG